MFLWVVGVMLLVSFTFVYVCCYLVTLVFTVRYRWLCTCNLFIACVTLIHVLIHVCVCLCVRCVLVCVHV